MVKRRRAQLPNKRVAQPQALTFPPAQTIAFITEVDDACLWKICDELNGDARNNNVFFIRGTLEHAQALLQQYNTFVLNRIGTRLPQNSMTELLMGVCEHPQKRISYYIDDFLVHRFDNLAVKMMETCHSVITTTEFLKEHFCSDLGIDASKIIVVPTHINLRLAENAPILPLPDDKFHILWPSSGVAGVDLFGEVLEELEKYDDVKDMSFTTITGSPMICKMHTYGTNLSCFNMGFVEYGLLLALEKSMDLIINPTSSEKANILVEDIQDVEKFLMGKAEVKFVHAGAMKKPVITTPNPAYEKCIRHGENGFLARSVQEWVDLIMMLYKDRDMRERVGLVAHEDVKANYASSVVIERYLDAYIDSGDVEKTR